MKRYYLRYFDQAWMDEDKDGTFIYADDYDEERDKLIYHLMSVIEQQCGYMRDDDLMETIYNSDAAAVEYLIKEGYAELRDGSKNFPETKKIKFRWREI